MLVSVQADFHKQFHISRDKVDLRPFASVELSGHAAFMFSLMGGHFFDVHGRMEARLRFAYFAFGGFFEVDWLSAADEPPEASGLEAYSDSTVGYGPGLVVSIGDFGKDRKMKWLINARWSPELGDSKNRFFAELIIGPGALGFGAFVRYIEAMGPMRDVLVVGAFGGVSLGS